jgi:hypothetical protein
VEDDICECECDELESGIHVSLWEMLCVFDEELVSGGTHVVLKSILNLTCFTCPHTIVCICLFWNFFNIPNNLEAFNWLWMRN